MPHTLTPRELLEELLARVMFVLTLVWLLLVGILVHRHQHFDETGHELRVLTGALAVTWPAFLVEGVLRLVLRGPGEGVLRYLGRIVALCFLPPLCLGWRSRLRNGAVWLPLLGWREPDKTVRRRLEKVFGLPLILVALLVLPLLVIDFYWQVQFKHLAWLGTIVEVSSAVIWLAFAVEFFIMLAVADSKLQHCKRHWLDMAIVFLPLFEFLLKYLDYMPLFRLLRLLRVIPMNTLTRMGRLYRLQGLAFRAWRAVLVLDVVQRLLGGTLEKQLARRQELLAAKEEELDELRQEIAKLRKRLAAKVSASPPAPAGSALEAPPPPRN